MIGVEMMAAGRDRPESPRERTPGESLPAGSSFSHAHAQPGDRPVAAEAGQTDAEKTVVPDDGSLTRRRSQDESSTPPRGEASAPRVGPNAGEPAIAPSEIAAPLRTGQADAWREIRASGGLGRDVIGPGSSGPPAPSREGRSAPPVAPREAGKSLTPHAVRNASNPTFAEGQGDGVENRLAEARRRPVSERLVVGPGEGAQSNPGRMAEAARTAAGVSDPSQGGRLAEETSVRAHPAKFTEMGSSGTRTDDGAGHGSESGVRDASSGAVTQKRLRVAHMEQGGATAGASKESPSSPRMIDAPSSPDNVIEDPLERRRASHVRDDNRTVQDPRKAARNALPGGPVTSAPASSSAAASLQDTGRSPVAPPNAAEAEAAASRASGVRLDDSGTPFGPQGPGGGSSSGGGAPTVGNGQAPNQPVVHTPTALADRVAAAISQRDDGVTELRLDPPELGRVRLTLGQGDQVLAATVIAERPEVADLMRRHAGALANALAEAGHEGAKLSFGAEGHDLGGGDTEADGGAGRAGSSTGVLPGEDAPVGAAPSRTASGVLDLRV